MIKHIHIGLSRLLKKIIFTTSKIAPKLCKYHQIETFLKILIGHKISKKSIFANISAYICAQHVWNPFLWFYRPCC